MNSIDKKRFDQLYIKCYAMEYTHPEQIRKYIMDLSDADFEELKYFCSQFKKLKNFNFEIMNSERIIKSIIE